MADAAPSSRHPSSSASSSSTETARGAEHAAEPSTDTLHAADLAGTTPTQPSSAHFAATTPPPSARSRPSAPTSAQSARTSSSPTPNPHRRATSSTSASTGASTAPHSAVNSPARRDLGHLSDSVLHEESAEEADDAFFGGAGGGVSASGEVPSRPRPRPTASLQPPTASAPAGSYRRSISVNTSASVASASSAAPAPARPSAGGLHNLHSATRLSATPTASASHSRARSGGSALPTQGTLRRSVSRSGTAGGQRSTTGSEAGSSGDEDAHYARSITHGYEAELADPPMGAQGKRREVVKSDDEDDEVRTEDRGEQLVRKRMRERKEARKAALAQRMKDESQRRLSAYTQHSSTPDYSDTLGLGHPTPGPSRVRDASIARSERSNAGFSIFSDGPRSPTFGPPGGGAPYSPLPFPPHHAHPPYPHVPRPQLGARGTSYLSSASATSRNASDTEGAGGPGSVVEEGEADEMSGTDPRMEDWRDGGADGPHEAKSDSDDGEVEYTLKDRQDAINVEHPFGLPIWKPALYKKSRSIARHAESAVHASPSSAALHHLLPSNVIWTLVFGVWLFVLCAVVAAVLFITPFGGSKYGRVVWELGTYLFWPFGKYVEGWTNEPHDLHSGQDIDEVDENAEDADEEDEAPGYRDDEDPEAGGRTFRRGRSGTINGNSVSTQQSTRPSVHDVFRDSGLPDEPRSRPAAAPTERTSLRDTAHTVYGANGGIDKVSRLPSSSSDATYVAPSLAPYDFSKDDDHGFRLRAFGRLMYWVAFYLVVAPVLLLVAAVCWGFVFTIPMAKLLWVLVRHLNNEPLALYFRSPPDYAPVAQDLATDVEAPDVHADGPSHNLGSTLVYPLRAGQPAPSLGRKRRVADKRKGRLAAPHPTVLLCTTSAAGIEYYKYTVDGVNIWFVNLLSLVVLVIADFFALLPYVERHYPHGGAGFLGVLTNQAFIFVLALLAVIPLSYFIGMAVASISAQSSIGVGAVINASFGSVIEIILYSIALTQAKGELVEGSIVGSILAGVLLMPGVSMVAGAVRRKEQRFNARSAGVTSMMLIMALIGTLTPTLFYEIYGSFQLTCQDCDFPTASNGPEACRTCYYEHVAPADDPFYRDTVVHLSYYCAIVLVLSYLIGLWFSLKTHASQIWQNAAPSAHEAGRPLSGVHGLLPDRRSLYQRLVPSQLFQQVKHRASATGNTPLATPRLPPSAHGKPGDHHPDDTMQLPHGLTQDEFNRAFEVVASAASVLRPHSSGAPVHHARAASHAREVSHQKDEDADGHGGHDAPNWSRAKSATVLLACTVLYAIIAEILVDVVDVILEGSGISEKLLGVGLFALVPNATEFMNAISFALNGNIALSMEIGSAYALQVCLIQVPAMLGFSAIYSIGKATMSHRAFTLVFPRWDAIAIIFSVFLLTYVYVEARSNYFRGSLLCLSYLVLFGGFVYAPADRDTSDNPGFVGSAALSVYHASAATALPFLARFKALVLSLFTQ
ncbi:hypothetical protein Rhopal_007359-T1 [Rhodotorula paludigena]|uniref:Calcium/proton exchanger n=1 Tax=Rhodotorula paludigena TaxID=86838 RepID=A0AAV5GWF4_9BASI|nr:hypothetical protein Rhopal_007359-T1 [Rhodotorula paludigena]